MSSSLTNVALIGANGKLGSYIFDAFKTDPRFNVTVITRQTSQASFPSDVKVCRVGDSYPESDLLAAFEGQDAVISTIATASAAQQKAIIDVAIKAGVKRFVPSEFGSDSRSKNAREIMPMFFEGKLDVVQYLKDKETEGITWTAFVPGVLFDLAIETGIMGYNLKDSTATILGDGTTPWSTTTRSRVGLAVKNAMLVPEKTANRYLFIDSFTASQIEVLGALQKATGGEWNISHVDAEETKRHGLEMLSRRDMSGAGLIIRYMNCVSGYGSDYMLYEQGDNDLLSLPKESLNEVVADIVSSGSK